MKPARHSLRLAIAIAIAPLLPACSLPPQGFWPSPLKPQKTETAAVPVALPEEESGQPKRSMTIEGTPTTPPPPTAALPQETSPPPTKKERADITLNFDQERLPTLVQLIYGTILKKNYTLDPVVASRPDLVTLRTGPQTPSQVEQTARLLLKSYGVAVLELGGGVLRIVPDSNLQGYAPEIRRGRALPKVPLPLRPIFQLVELQAVRNTDVASWVKNLFPGNKLTVSEDPGRNAIMLSGLPDDVAAAMEAIQVLDRPGMKGRHSARINPVFLNADEMAKRLSELMTAEGYAAGTSTSTNYPVTFIPIAGINAVIVFAAEQSALSHALDWARDLDQPSLSPSNLSYFTYQARNTDAEKLATTLRQMLNQTGGGTQASTAPSGGVGAATTPGVTAPPVQAQALTKALKVVVNPATNTLIFQGDNEEYQRMLNLLQEIDKPAKAALIEVTVADVNLKDSLELGVELSSQMLEEGAFRVLSGGTTGGMILKYFAPGGPTTGADAIRALASQNRAKILSSPRLMARNGETASIQVGQSVPILTQSQTNQATGGTGIIQSIQYKDIGVILKVKPVIYSGDRIELEIYQEVSSANATNTGVNNSPTFDTKKVETRLALKDGSTVMLGGLISDERDDGNAGVPYLKEIPWLGQLFRKNTEDNNRRELIILITPYTVLDDHDAQSITETFRGQLGPWASKHDIRAPGTPR